MQPTGISAKAELGPGSPGALSEHALWADLDTGGQTLSPSACW